MKPVRIVLIVLLSFAVSLATASFFSHKQSVQQVAARESRWEQVKRTGVLRCGYAVWPPFLEKDPNTGQISGITHDLVEAIGQKLSLKVEWTAETGWGEMFSNYNRYDIVCDPFVRTGARARETDFTTTLGYLPLYVYTRSGDTRFDNNYAVLDKPDIKLATTDGDYSDIIASEEFPHAKKVALSQLASGAQLIEQVASGKADAVVTEPFSLDSYRASNPGKIKRAAGAPLRTLNFSLPLPPNEPAFKSMIDGALAELADTGFIDKTFAHYETGEARVLRVAKPYVQP